MARSNKSNSVTQPLTPAQQHQHVAAGERGDTADPKGSTPRTVTLQGLHPTGSATRDPSGCRVVSPSKLLAVALVSHSVLIWVPKEAAAMEHLCPVSDGPPLMSPLPAAGLAITRPSPLSHRHAQSCTSLVHRDRNPWDISLTLAAEHFSGHGSSLKPGQRSDFGGWLGR
ncbi:hypothetical protein NDU88_001285 [Pleurodeles waltl]|uniref:Uncharacterized protein n=1 Tax=Pleurodeles waltl TaxID=8319 RepID=A0AAV7NAB6_PLEWA|nr:hypothetical protein NDU88_001285 [Pleurodeles waltl]